MPTEKLSRIKEVADYVGVSISTVSRVINNHPYVNKEVRERVLEAIKILGYNPNYAARSMRAKSTRLIGLLIRDISNPNFAKVVKAAESIASQHEYGLLLCNSSLDSKKEKHYIDIFLRHRVDGLIVYVADESINNFKAVSEQIPIVLVDSELPGVSASRVLTQFEQGMFEATEHLIKLGHRNIGLLIGKQDSYTQRQRMAGFRKALSQYGVNVGTQYIRFCDLETDHAVQETRFLFSLPKPPTAIIAASNQLTFGALAAFDAMNISIPQDVSFIGCDDTNTTMLYKPRLTVISRDVGKLGEEPARLLFESLKNKGKREEKEIFVPTRLIVRESTIPLS